MEMDTIKQSLVIKNRSYAACITEAHRMLFSNIKIIFKKTWPFAAACAVTSALVYFFCTKAVIYEDFSTIGPAISIVLSLCASIAYMAKVMTIMNYQDMKWNVMRNIKACLCSIAFAALLVIILIAVNSAVNGLLPEMAQKNMYAFALTNLVTITIMGCAMLPYSYVGMKYIMEPETKLKKIIFGAYKTGVRHWGFIFATLLLAFLCVTVCTFVITIPMGILFLAKSLSLSGVAYSNDPSGLPPYFDLMQSAAMAITSFVCIYINMFLIFVYCFMYGSIEAREREKNKFLQTNEQNNIEQK